MIGVKAVDTGGDHLSVLGDEQWQEGVIIALTPPHWRGIRVVWLDSAEALAVAALEALPAGTPTAGVR